jgi:molybdate transport system ATP-binding protein
MNLSVVVQRHLSPGFTLDVAFTADPGVTILFGRSGSGKTTLLRLVAGLLTPDHGRVAIGERTLFDRAAAVDVTVRRRRLGYVFQQLALFPHLSVADNIGYGLDALDPGARRERVNAIASLFHIDHLLTRMPGATSGGERQRTALARALVTDPEFLLLDEPLSALDYPTQVAILDDLRAWNAVRRIPVLYVTHAHREVFSLGDRVLAIEAGRIVADGTPYEVLEMPTVEPLAQMVGFENFMSGVVESRRRDAGTMQCRLNGLDVVLEVPLSRAAEGASVRIALRAGDILLATEEPRGLSARNVLPGRLLSLHREGATVVARVAVASGRGLPLVVHLTPNASTALHLAVDMAVWLVIKTHSCRIMREDRTP